ncbi:hypothetical protein [Geotalea toluenoxydans]|uniref:hypothetical protein n=1 Tax=Geotalea toluenoxydans TaxID=421624 RepID=UPI000A6CB39B|nr:hypothetical protein [Geotalea toluenoxydans]
MKLFTYSYVLFVISVYLIFCNYAYAYLDPGAGSYVFQVVVAAIVGGVFTIKMFWQKIKNHLVKFFHKNGGHDL